MSNIVTFRTHSAFHDKMETTLEGFLRRLSLWMTQRNSYDADHSGSKYFDRRLGNILTFAVHAAANKLDIQIDAQRHNFDEEGNSFSYTDFLFTLPSSGPCQTSLEETKTANEAVATRNKHYFYQLSVGDQRLDWDSELRELMEESIPNADVESLIGNLLMLAQLPGMNLINLVDVVRCKLNTHRIKLLLTEIEKTGSFYIYECEEGNVLSILPIDHEVNGMLIPLKAVLVDANEFASTAWCRDLAKHRNRITYALRY